MVSLEGLKKKWIGELLSTKWILCVEKALFSTSFTEKLRNEQTNGNGHTTACCILKLYLGCHLAEFMSHTQRPLY